MSAWLVVAAAGLWLPVAAPVFAQNAPECPAVFKGVRASEITLSPCGEFLAAAGYQDETDEAIALLIVWNLKTKKEVFRHRDPEGGFETVAFRPDSKLLAAAGVGSLKTAKVWEFPSGKEIARLQSDEIVDCLRFSPDGKFLAMTTRVPEPEDDARGQRAAIVFFDTEKFKKTVTLRAYEKTISKLAFSHDGKDVIAGDAGGVLHCWSWRFRNEGDFPTFRERIARLLSVNVATESNASRWESMLRAVAFGNASNLCASGGGRGQIQVITDLTDPDKMAKVHKLLPALTGNEDAFILSLAFSPDDKWLFASGCELPPGKKFGVVGTLQVWNVAEKKLHVDLLKDVKYLVLSMAISRDGRTLVAGCNDATVRVWALPKEFHASAPKGQQ